MKKRIIGTVFAVILSLLLSVAISLGTLYYVRNRNVEKTGNVLGVSWYNEDEEEFTITTKEQLLEFSRLSNYYTFKEQTIKLGADIIFNEGDAKEWETSAPQTNWSPIYNFAGTFDGQGHTVSGLYGKSYGSPMGLFAQVDYVAIVKNLKITNSYFETSGGKGVGSFVANGGGNFKQLYSDVIIRHKGQNAGGIAGVMTKQAIFEECWYAGTIYAQQRQIGGLIAQVKSPRVEVKHCLFSGTINQDYIISEATRTGGILGYGKEGSGLLMEDCLSSGVINQTVGTQIGSVIGSTEANTDNLIKYVYAKKSTYKSVIGNQGGTYQGAPTDMYDEELTGVKAYQWTELDFNNYWAAIEASTPVLKCFSNDSMDLTNVAKAYDISWYDSEKTMFEIMTKEQLYGFWVMSCQDNFANKIVRLGADIKLNEGKASDWRKNAPENKWKPIGTTNYFAGTFDGQGHTISGIYVNATAPYAGFFGHTDLNSMVKNLKLTNSYITSTSTHVGSAVGHAYGSIYGIYSDAIVDVKGVDTLSNMVGGITGVVNYFTRSYNYKQSIQNCWFDGEIIIAGRVNNTGGITGALAKYGSGDVSKSKITVAHCLFSGTIRSDEESELKPAFSNVGGIMAAEMSGMTVYMEDCYSSGTINVNSKTSTGAILGKVAYNNSSYTIEDVYASLSSCPALTPGKGIGNFATEAKGGVAILKDDWMIGKAAYQWSGLDFENYWTTVTGSTPILSSFASKKESIKGLNKLADQSWYDDTKEEMTIKTLEELYGFYIVSAFDNFKGQTVKLGANIAINTGNAADWATVAPANEWLPIANDNYFAGTFDGQGYTISGIYINTDASQAGLFGHTQVGSMIKNLKVTNSYIKTSSTHAGSVIGHSYGSIDSLYSDAIIEAEGGGYFIGGLVGCMNYYTEEYKTKMSATNCWFDGSINVTGNKQGVGGIIGAIARAGFADGTKAKVTIEHCLNTGTITCDSKVSYIGGIVGCDWMSVVLEVTDCLNVGTITGGKNYGAIIGRIVKGETSYAVKDSYATKSSCSLAGYGTNLPDSWLIGNKAYQYTYLDFVDYWTTVENDTPILRKFASNPLTVSGDKMLDISWYNETKNTFVLKDLADLYGFYLLSSTNNFAGKTVKLGADIAINTGDASTYAATAPENIWMPIGTSKAFAGTFDGQGHTISGMYINSTGSMSGFFGFTEVGSMVKNLKIKNSYIKTTSTHAGSVVGHAYGSVDSVYSNAIIDASGSGYFIGGIVGVTNYYTKDYSVEQSVTNCWFDGTINVSDNKQAVGGIVGAFARAGFADKNQAKTTVAHCLNTGTITVGTSVTRVGGIGGSVWFDMKIVLDDCLNVGKISGTTSCGAVLGASSASSGMLTVSDCYAMQSSCAYAGKAILLPDEMLKGNAAYEYSYLDFENYWTTVENDTPMLRLYAEKIETPTGERKIDINWYYSNPDATEFEIGTAPELYGFALIGQTNSFAGKTIKLTADITLNEGNAAAWKDGHTDDVMLWSPIGVGGYFAGIFDGQGHTISGMYASGTDRVGMFGYTDKTSVIKNFAIVNSCFKGTYFVGSVVGWYGGTIEGVYSNAYVVVSEPGHANGGRQSGGIAGTTMLDNALIKNCWFDGMVDGDTYLGGIVGDTNNKANAMIENCLFTGLIYSDWLYSKASNDLRIGGILGRKAGSNGYIKDCLSVGQIVIPGLTSDAYVGSVVGLYSHAVTFEDIYATTNNIELSIGRRTNDDAALSGIYELTLGELTGTDAQTNATGLDWVNTWATVENGTPVLRGLTEPAKNAKKEKMPDTSWYYKDTSATTFEIGTAEELLGLSLISKGYNFSGKTILLTKDIVLNSGSASDWKNGQLTDVVSWPVIGSNSSRFAGKFYGQNHSISGAYTVGADRVGLFSCTTGSYLKEFRVVNSYFKGTYFVGSVVGWAGGTVESIYSDAYVVAEDASSSNGGRQAGGIVGAAIGANLYIKKCWFAGEVDGDTYLGGIIGDYNNMANVNVQNSLFTGVVRSDMKTASTDFRIGGIIGRKAGTNGSIEDCVSVGNVEVPDAVAADYVGAAIGLYSHGMTIIDVYASTKYVECSIGGKTNDAVASVYEFAEAGLIGETARTNASGLDWTGTWVTVEGSTPVLKIFEDLAPKTEAVTMNLFTRFMALFTGKEI